MVFLFQLLIANNWNVFMQSVVDASNSPWARLFCISYWVLAVILIFNLAVAHVPSCGQYVSVAQKSQTDAFAWYFTYISISAQFD